MKRSTFDSMTNRFHPKTNQRTSANHAFFFRHNLSIYCAIDARYRNNRQLCPKEDVCSFPIANFCQDGSTKSVTLVKSIVSTIKYCACKKNKALLFKQIIISGYESVGMTAKPKRSRMPIARCFPKRRPQHETNEISRWGPGRVSGWNGRK